MDASVLSDADLARRITSAGSAGARDAEAELYTRLVPRVRLYGLRYLRDEQSTVDLTQQVLLMTIERLRDGKIREPERLASYVLGTCRMVVLDLRRGRWRRERVLRQFSDDLPRAGGGRAAARHGATDRLPRAPQRAGAERARPN